MGHMVGNEQSGFLQTFQVFETRHFDAAQQPRQGKDETLEESRTSPSGHSAERPTWVGIWRCTADLNGSPRRPEVSLLPKASRSKLLRSARSRFNDDFCRLLYPLGLELFFHISKRRRGGHAGFIQLNLIVILQQAKQLDPPQGIQLQVRIQPQ